MYVTKLFCDYPPHWLSLLVRTAVFAVKTMACDGQHGSRGAASLHGLVLAMCAFCLFYFTAVFLGYEHFTVRLSCPHERHPTICVFWSGFLPVGRPGFVPIRNNGQEASVILGPIRYSQLE